jgi:hypothetical protein
MKKYIEFFVNTYWHLLMIYLSNNFISIQFHLTKKIIDECRTVKQVIFF